VPSRNQLFEYESLIYRLSALRQRKVDLLGTYTVQNARVQAAQTQIDRLEAERSELERKFPQLAARGTKAGESADLVSENARLAGLVARVESLRERFREAQARAKQLSELGPQIAELERKKEVEEANYKYFQSTLDKTRIDEALDPSKMPNITAVQKPSVPVMVTAPRTGLALKLAGGGIALGVAIALALDFVLNRTVRRRVELERRLRTPVLMSIPFMGAHDRLRLSMNGSRNGNGSDAPPAHGGPNGTSLAPWSAGHFLRPYCQAIRDRIGLYFELNKLTHKPKLVGVASFSSHSGTSTIAAGLAAALSETDDGKVLLVDANLGPQNVHPFFAGKPAYSLAAALQSSTEIDPASENLYLASVGSAQAGPAQLGLKKFFDMMPNLKASDFDYIIFDMPPLEQTSPSWGMAPFMDKMLVIVEAEKVDRDVVERGYNRLMAGRDNISVLFNKARSYGPQWMQIEE
jgi:Mrp family chromosome partitioning ATPase